jgi:hypothetical protein
VGTNLAALPGSLEPANGSSQPKEAFMKRPVQATTDIVAATHHREPVARLKGRVRGAMLVANHNKVSPVKKLVRGAKLATNHNKAAPRVKGRIRGAKIIANHNRLLAR